MIKITMIGIALVFALSVSGTCFAKMTCTVESVNGDTMTLKGCDKDKAAKLKMNDAVTVTAIRKKK